MRVGHARRTCAGQRRRIIRTDVGLLADEQIADIADVSYESEAHFPLHKQVPGLDVATTEIRPQGVCALTYRQRHKARAIVGYSWNRDAIREGHRAACCRIDGDGSKSAGLAIVRLNVEGVLVAQLAHVIRIDGHAGAGANYGFVVEAIRDTEAGREESVPRINTGALGVAHHTADLDVG